MPYVNVPVPEEHVEEVMQFVLRAMARASQEPWDAESMTTLFAEVDELSRALLSYVSRGVLTGKELTEGDAAKLMQLSARETLAIQRELNDTARNDGRPVLISQRLASEVLPNGRSLEKRLLTMDEDTARLVHRAERTEILDDPLPPDEAR